MEFIKNISHCKSKSSYDCSTDENLDSQAYQSLVENRKENQINDANACLPAKQSGMSVEKQHKL